EFLDELHNARIGLNRGDNAKIGQATQAVAREYFWICSDLSAQNFPSGILPAWSLSISSFFRLTSAAAERTLKSQMIAENDNADEYVFGKTGSKQLASPRSSGTFMV